MTWTKMSASVLPALLDTKQVYLPWCLEETLKILTFELPSLSTNSLSAFSNGTNTSPWLVAKIEPSNCQLISGWGTPSTWHFNSRVWLIMTGIFRLFNVGYRMIGGTEISSYVIVWVCLPTKNNEFERCLFRSCFILSQTSVDTPMVFLNIHQMKILLILRLLKPYEQIKDIKITWKWADSSTGCPSCNHSISTMDGFLIGHLRVTVSFSFISTSVYFVVNNGGSRQLGCYADRIGWSIPKMVT